MSAKHYFQWTEADRNELLAKVKVFSKNGRVNWNAIARLYKNRTKQQLKSYYLNVLKNLAVPEVIDPVAKEIGSSLEFMGVANTCCFSPRLLARKYPDLSTTQLQQAMKQLVNTMADIDGCLVFVMSYSAADQPIINPELLDKIERIATFYSVHQQYEAVCAAIRAADATEAERKFAMNGMEHVSPERCQMCLQKIKQIREDDSSKK